MENGISQELLGLQNAWSKTTAAKIPPPVDDGDYVCKLVNMNVGKSKNGRLQVVTIFRIADGNNTGKEILRYDGLNNEVSMSFFKAYCETIGLEHPSEITDLESAIKSFVDSFNSLVNVTVKTKDNFTNLYVKGLVEYNPAA